MWSRVIGEHPDQAVSPEPSSPRTIGESSSISSVLRGRSHARTIATVSAVLVAMTIAAQAWGAPRAVPHFARPPVGIRRQARAQSERGLATPRHSSSDRYFFGFINQWNSWTPSGGPQSLATDDNGNVYTVAIEVIEYTNMGTLVTRWEGSAATRAISSVL